jgi:hypothetical protein
MIKQVRMREVLVRYMKEVELNSVEQISRRRLERKREGCGGGVGGWGCGGGKLI